MALIPVGLCAAKTAQDVYAHASKSVCLVTGKPASGGAQIQGTGFTVTADGLVVTNRHVVKDATDLAVECNNVRSYVTNVRYDPDGRDLAVLHTGLNPTTFLTLGAPVDSTSVGMTLFVIGNPFGLQNTITEGILSGVRSDHDSTYLQLSAAINPGNSGGPVLDGNGNVIGVATAFVKGFSGIGFAIDARHVLRLTTRERGYLAPNASTGPLHRDQAPRIAEIDPTSAPSKRGQSKEGNDRVPVVTKYTIAANRGSALAQALLGVLYWRGDGVDMDSEMAVHWWMKASSQGNAESLHNLGVAWNLGKGVPKREITTARTFWKRAAAEGFAESALALGESYEATSDLPKSTELSLFWYEKAQQYGRHIGALEKPSRLRSRIADTGVSKRPDANELPATSSHSKSKEPESPIQHAIDMWRRVFGEEVREVVEDRAELIKELLIEVQPGDTLDSLFRESGLSLVDLSEIQQLDTARKNLRVLRPGDTLSVQHDHGVVLELERDVGIGQTLVVRRNDAASGTASAADPMFSAELVSLPAERRVVTTGFRISGSLFEAAANAGLSEKVVMKLAEIFAWDIDFVRDINTDDEFTLVYEELWRNGKKLGEGEVLVAEVVNRGQVFTGVRYDGGDGRQSYYICRSSRAAQIGSGVGQTSVSRSSESVCTPGNRRLP